MSTLIRVLLADDHTILRAGLRMLIKGQPDMEIVGEASTSLEAIKLVGSLTPDVVILDLTMPGGGLRAIEAIRQACSSSRVLVLTMHDDQAYLRSALAAGAAGYLVKRAADAELLSAIRTVFKGRSYIDVALADSGLQSLIELDSVPNPNGLNGLSAREREVLELVAYGYTNREIADHLHISIKSVETYRARVLEKLGFKTRADLVRFALEMGLVHSETNHKPTTTAIDSV